MYVLKTKSSSLICKSSLSSFGRKSWKTLGTLLVSSLPDTVTRSTIYDIFLKVMTPFWELKDDISKADQTMGKSSLDNESASVDMSSNVSKLTSKNNNSLEDDT
jgi:ubiquitin carboxyl-terminal hydrolase 15